MRLRSVYHTPKSERGIGKWIVAWTWVLAAVYSVPKLFRKPPEGSTRWKEYKRALKYNYSHEELWIPDENGEFWSEAIDYLGTSGQRYYKSWPPQGQCFSSTTRGDAEGVRFAPTSEVVGKHPERWRYIEFEVDDWIWEHIVLPDLKSKVGNKYDFAAVTTGFITPIMIDPKDKDYCSGICCWAKFLLGILKVWYKRISPRRSAYETAKIHGEPKPVKEIL